MIVSQRADAIVGFAAQHRRQVGDAESLARSVRR
jgi:hypothetical protein